MSATSKKINLSGLALKQKNRHNYVIIEKGKGGGVSTTTLSAKDFLAKVQEDKTGRMAMEHLNLLTGPKATIEGIAQMFT